MKKTILVTGATDGIGLATVKVLAEEGHNLLIHGRNAEKLADVQGQLSALPSAGNIQTYQADLSELANVDALAKTIIAEHKSLDVLINNAGVFKVSDTRTNDGLDVRFSVNTFAPYILSQQLLPLLGQNGRIINLSSAAQAPVNIEAMQGEGRLADMEAYAQSKLAITMWSNSLTEQLGSYGPAIIAVNPGSLLASKMVKEGFGVAGQDINIGANILVKLSVENFGEVNSEVFKKVYSGKYFDNDKGAFGAPHPDAMNAQKSAEIIDVMQDILAKLSSN